MHYELEGPLSDVPARIEADLSRWSANAAERERFATRQERNHLVGLSGCALPFLVALPWGFDIITGVPWGLVFGLAVTLFVVGHARAIYFGTKAGQVHGSSFQAERIEAFQRFLGSLAEDLGGGRVQLRGAGSLAFLDESRLAAEPLGEEPYPRLEVHRHTILEGTLEAPGGERLELSVVRQGKYRTTRTSRGRKDGVTRYATQRELLEAEDHFELRRPHDPAAPPPGELDFGPRELVGAPEHGVDVGQEVFRVTVRSALPLVDLEPLRVLVERATRRAT